LVEERKTQVLREMVKIAAERLHRLGISHEVVYKERNDPPRVEVRVITEEVFPQLTQKFPFQRLFSQENKTKKGEVIIYTNYEGEVMMQIALSQIPGERETVFVFTLIKQKGGKQW